MSEPRSRARGYAPVGVFLLVIALAVGFSLPANVFASAAAPLIVSELPENVDPEAAVAEQAIAVDEAVIASESLVERDGFSAQSFAAAERERYQALGLGFAPGYVPTTGTVRWPFPVSVPITSGFGERDGAFHYGIDLTPGEGTPVGVIADGVVTWVGWKGDWGYGYYVDVQHNINGVPITSRYGHMIDGSSPVYPGQEITVGTIVGLTGNTGNSYGAHLHLEVYVGAERVDPFVWMTENANNDAIPTPGG